MNNLVFNSVSIFGPPKLVAALVAQVRGETAFNFNHSRNGENVVGQVFSFHCLIPITGEWKSSACLKKWGSTSEAIDVKLNYFNGSCAIYEFETFSKAPKKIFYELKNRFSDVFVSWFFCQPQQEICGYFKHTPVIKEVL